MLLHTYKQKTPFLGPFFILNFWVRVMVFNATFSYIVAVSFIGGENRSTSRKPSTCR